MKAITLWQPWASLIVTGAKKIETRSWKTDYRGPLAIHAAKRWTRDQQLMARGEPFKTILMEANILDVPLGKVLGTCDLVDTCEIVDTRRYERDGELYYIDQQEWIFGDWRKGRYAWPLENPVRFPQPVPAMGKQGLWEWMRCACCHQTVVEEYKHPDQHTQGLFYEIIHEMESGEAACSLACWKVIMEHAYGE